MPLFYPQKSLCVYTHIYLFIKYGEVFKGLSVMLSKTSVHAEFFKKNVCNLTVKSLQLIYEISAEMEE